MTDDQQDFGKRVRVARVWAGYARQSDFGDALADRWPDWPVRTNVKRVELGTRYLDYGEQVLWAKRIAEFTGIPEWFMVAGWEGAAEKRPIDEQLEELRATVAHHDQLLRDELRNRPAPPEDVTAPADQAATTLRRAATEARQQQAERPARKPAASKRKQG